jgi:hypothetical protein
MKRRWDDEILARIQNIPTFGELGYALIPKPLREGKFTEVSEECIFLGIEEITSYPIVFLIQKGEVQAVRTVKFTKSFVVPKRWTNLEYNLGSTFEEL